MISPQCQWQTQSLALHLILLWILFLASEEGSRYKITGLPESNSLELELHLLSGEMRCCYSTRKETRSLVVLVLEVTLALSKAGFALCCSFLQPPLFQSVSTPSLFCHKHLACKRHCCPGNWKNISTRRDIKRQTGKKKAAFVTENLLTRWHLQRGWWIDCDLARGFRLKC